jgi:hypothetical protein
MEREGFSRGKREGNNLGEGILNQGFLQIVLKTLS